MNGFRKPRGLRPSERRALLRRETIPANVGEAALGRSSAGKTLQGNLLYMLIPRAAGGRAAQLCRCKIQRFKMQMKVGLLPCSSYANLSTLVDNRKVVRLGGHVWKPSTIRVIKALPGIPKNTQKFFHSCILI